MAAECSHQPPFRCASPALSASIGTWCIFVAGGEVHQFTMDTPVVLQRQSVAVLIPVPVGVHTAPRVSRHAYHRQASKSRSRLYVVSKTIGLIGIVATAHHGFTTLRPSELGERAIRRIPYGEMEDGNKPRTLDNQDITRSRTAAADSGRRSTREGICLVNRRLLAPSLESGLLVAS